MKHFIAFFLLLYFFQGTTIAQNSVLVNFGSQGCYNASAPAFSLINKPLSASPSTLANCSMSPQVPNFFSVFIAYNPKNNKIYVADVRSGTETKIWLLDVGIPQSISCPPIIPLMPTYSYSYVSNNFEFDNNGDLWSFSNYNAQTGACNMEKFDVNTGAIINTRIVQFPAGNFPTDISSGDLCILPNGRMFATLGSAPSRLYEILDYSSTTGPAAATYLQTLPKDCFGIAYLNGQLEITGIDESCYYFDYDIATNTLGQMKPFQVGEAPIDNTSFTPSLGTTKQLVHAVKVNANTADLTYEIFVRNIGNVIINGVNVIEDLGAVFGAGNVSNVSAAFMPDNNGPGLTLNPAFNGTTNTSLLNIGQHLANQTGPGNNYYFKLQVQCRVTNLSAPTTYFNSAISKGFIGSTANLSVIPIQDSSNNGGQTVVDPNNNGNAGEIGENVPTPFNFGTLPVRFVQVNASLQNQHTAVIKWTVATPTVNAKFFIVEFSTDGTSWTSLGEIPIVNPARGAYNYQHENIPAGKLYYRIKEIDNDGSYMYSRIVLLQQAGGKNSFVLFPNPANSMLQISAPGFVPGKLMIELFDATGRKMLSRVMQGTNEAINTSDYPPGTYYLKFHANGEVSTQKVLIVR